MRKLMSMRQPPTAVFAASDMWPSAPWQQPGKGFRVRKMFRLPASMTSILPPSPTRLSLRSECGFSNGEMAVEMLVEMIEGIPERSDRSPWTRN